MRRARTQARTHPSGTETFFLIDDDHPDWKDVTSSRPSSVSAMQVDAVTAVAQGDEVPYATGEDGAKNVEILEKLIEG